MRERWQGLWENQAPLVRNNVNMALWAVLGVLLLTGLVWVMVWQWTPTQYFAYTSLLTLLRSLLILLLIIVGYQALRTTLKFILRQDVVTWLGVLLSWMSVLGVGGALWGMPSFVDAAIARADGQPYFRSYQAFSRECERWMAQSREMGDILQVDGTAVALGQSVWQVQNTVIIDYSERRPAFGFACVLDQDIPAALGRANDFQYEHISGGRYKFYEQEN